MGKEGALSKGNSAGVGMVLGGKQSSAPEGQRPRMTTPQT